MTLFTRVTRWDCPNCNYTDVTREALPHTRFHSCRTGLTAPMVEQGTRVKIEVHVREDYVGKELVQCDANGKPVMSVTVTRDDGQDCTVYAPTARARKQEL